jgi:putative salt-induced outer membrane protein
MKPAFVGLAVLALSTIFPARAQDAPAAAPAPPPPAWTDAAELAYVVTSGNSQSSTFGFKNTLTWKKAPSRFELKMAGIRVETTSVNRVVVATGPVVDETETSTTTAESYVVTGRFDRTVTQRLFWFGGAGWDRNRFAGVDNRYTGFAGMGNLWHDSDHIKFRTDYAVTMTRQEDVIDNPEVDDTFAGLRFSWKYEHKFNNATTYGNDLVLDENLEETSDWRGDMVNWLTVAMTRRLALKVSLKWLYDNEPSSGLISDPGDLAPPTGTEAFFPLEELDTIFTTALVINI